MQYGMIGYVIPLQTYPVTYNGQPLEYIALASQKNYMSLYLMNIYGDKDAEQWVMSAFALRYVATSHGSWCQLRASPLPSRLSHCSSPRPI